MRLAWVTGAGGLIGSHIVRAARSQAPEWTVRGLTRLDLDLAHPAAVESAFAAERPELVIHCAALSKSPECEADPPRAWRENFEVTERLAQLAADRRLIFFSTDLVFNGQSGNYEESSPLNPLSVYARTKAAAEKVVSANPKHTVIRTSLNAGCSPSADRAFNEQLRLAWQRGEKTRLFTDEFRCPIAAPSTALIIWEVVRQELCGCYHLAGAEKLSRWQIGQLLASHYKLDARIEPARIADYSGAPRAPDTSLNCAKLERELGMKMPPFSQSLHLLD